jgi:murein L,D-transpeptidase YcbB/YkuD
VKTGGLKESSNFGKPATKLPRAARAPSTPESRSAAALALSADPVFDEGTYQRIKETLLSYAAIQVRGGRPAIPADSKLAPGANGPEVALLRKLLVISDDLEPELEAGDSYDAALVDAVKHFQLRHGLEANGSIGPQTLRALNVPVAARIKQLEASLERLLGMDFVFAERYVVVNIPLVRPRSTTYRSRDMAIRIFFGPRGERGSAIRSACTEQRLVLDYRCRVRSGRRYRSIEFCLDASDADDEMFCSFFLTLICLASRS